MISATHRLCLTFTGTDSLDLEVARTRDILYAAKSSRENKCLKRGYMWRQTINKQYTSSWMLRFFRLKEDLCLYSYKNEYVSGSVKKKIIIK